LGNFSNTGPCRKAATAPEGLKAFHQHHPDMSTYDAAIYRQLNDHGYIVPGLGDAGDRLFGSKQAAS